METAESQRENGSLDRGNKVVIRKNGRLEILFGDTLSGAFKWLGSMANHLLVIETWWCTNSSQYACFIVIAL